MTCPDCNSEMRVWRTSDGGTSRTPTKLREHRCDCGQRFLSEDRITRRLTAISGNRGPAPSLPNGGKPTVNGSQTDVPQDTCIQEGGKGGSLSAPILPSGLTPDLSDLRLDLFQGVDPARVKPKKSKRQETPAFQAFYAAYPRKTARDRAWLNWESVGAEAHAAAIMAALAWQVPLVFSKRTFDKIPHPGTWLTDGCWKDERPKSVTEPLRMARPSGPPVAIAELAGQRARQIEEAAERARIEDAERFKQQRQLAEGKS